MPIERHGRPLPKRSRWLKPSIKTVSANSSMPPQPPPPPRLLLNPNSSPCSARIKLRLSSSAPLPAPAAPPANSASPSAAAPLVAAAALKLWRPVFLAEVDVDTAPGNSDVLAAFAGDFWAWRVHRLTSWCFRLFRLLHHHRYHRRRCRAIREKRWILGTAVGCSSLDSILCVCRHTIGWIARCRRLRLLRGIQRCSTS